MKLIVVLCISLFFSSIPLLNITKGKTKKEFIRINKLHIMFFFVIFIGCFVRLYEIERFPLGLNQDEASSGYEAFSLLNYGVDRNGMSFPAHFISWGSGQNILYSYLIMPFINIIDNITIAIRLPMALIGCLTLLLSYLFIKDNDYYDKYGLISLFIIAIIPWHIMKSRFGLESNLFPDIFLYGLMLLYCAIKKDKNIYFILSSIIFGISIYSYGTSYLFIPAFMLMTYMYLTIEKKVTVKKAIFYILITALVSLPMILFVIINYFDLNTIKIFNITIPKLYYNRFTTITSVNGSFISNIISNLKSSIIIILFQKDGVILNYTTYYGVYYFISIPFMIYGFIYSIKHLKENDLYKLNFIYFISSIIICMMVEPNINRINCIWFSLIIYIIIGIIHIVCLNKFICKIIIVLYLVSFGLFSNYYFTKYQTLLTRWPRQLNKALNYTSDKKYTNLYITTDVNQPYIYYLLYKKVNPYYYVSNRNILRKKAMFQHITSINNIYFQNETSVAVGNIYIVKINYNIHNSNMCNVIKYDDFKVIDCTKKE